MKIYTQAEVDALLVSFGTHLVLEYSDKLQGDAPAKERRAEANAKDELKIFKGMIPGEVDITPFGIAGDIVKAAKTTIEGSFGEREQYRRVDTWEQLKAYVDRNFETQNQFLSK